MMYNTIWCVFVGLFGVSLVAADADKLVYSHIVFRHGDRAPSDNYPTDPNGENNWPQGWKELTTLGMKQGYHLGEFIRSEYADTQKLISREYKNKEIYVQSSDSNRAVQTALSFLSGLYPPDANQTFMTGLKWQPVSLSTFIPSDEDVLLKPTSTECDAGNALYNEHVPGYNDEMNQKYPGFFEFVSNKSGLADLDASTIHDLYTACFRENIHHLPQPDWLKQEWKDTNKTVFELVVEMNNWLNVKEFTIPGMARLLGGYLLGDILDRMQDKADGKVKKSDSLVVYSAHAGTIMPLMVLFDFPLVQIPTYTSCVMIELFEREISKKLSAMNAFSKATKQKIKLNMGKQDHEYYVQLRYSTSEKLDEMANRKAIVMPCDSKNNTKCELKAFVKKFEGQMFGKKHERRTACNGAGILAAQLALFLLILVSTLQNLR